MSIHRFQAGDPQPGCLIISLGFLFLITLKFFVVFIFGFFAVTVMRLVVQDEDVFHAHKVRHHSLKHLTLGFKGIQIISSPLK